MAKDWLNELKHRFKKYPRFYGLLMDYISPVKGHKKKNYRIIYDHLPVREDGFVINLGSGPFRLNDQIINVDMNGYYGKVDLIADLHHLPFKDGSIDGVINVAVLEHVRDQKHVIDEAYRVLKNGGLIYSVIPFIVGFHASPEDYYRETSEGIKYVHKSFSIVDTGVAAGPTSGLLWVLQEWLAMVFSFGSVTLYKILYIFFNLTLWPIKFLDVLLVYHPMAKMIASSFYFLGKK